MTRIKRGVASSRRRKNILEDAKGFRWRRSTNYRAAKEAIIKAGAYAFRDRRAKKRVMRKLWITRLNIALHDLGLKYSQFIKIMSDKNILLDRKVLSQLAVTEPKIFAKLIESLK